MGKKQVESQQAIPFPGCFHSHLKALKPSLDMASLDLTPTWLSICFQLLSRY